MGYSDRLGETHTYGVRPFFHIESLDSGRIDNARFLWPAAIFDTRNGTEKRLSILLLFYHIQRNGQYGPETDWALAPLLFGGREGDGETYFAFFPFFGTMRNLLARDEIEFYAFPFYMRIRRGDFNSTHILWPLTQFGSGGGQESLRILPFYGYDKIDGRIESKSILWPFFHWEKSDLHTDDPASLFHFFPFYARKESETANHTAVAWPFFSWSEDLKANTVERNLPWPFHKSVDSPELRRFRIWPFFGTYSSEEVESKFWLWPFFYQRKERTDVYDKDAFHIVPFYADVSQAWLDTGKEEVYRKLWPLFRFERDNFGGSHFSYLSLIPWRKLGPFEEDYGFLWKLYESETREDNSGFRRLYLGLAENEYGPDYDSYTIPFLFDYYRVREKSVTQFLWGLVRLEKDEEETALSLLWLPSFLRW